MNSAKIRSISAALVAIIVAVGAANSAADDAPVVLCERATAPTPVTLQTDDGVKLLADYYPSGNPGGPGVVLLHMIPPRFDYKSYPEAFIRNLVAETGASVININRRGAKGSGGVAKAAYKGEKGWLDAKAGRDFLVLSPCAVASDQIAMIGASNGTTTLLDYAVEAAAREDLDPPSRIVFMSAGQYTENQHSFRAALTSIGAPPIYAVYSANEKQWNESAAAIAKAGGVAWSATMYEPGTHGTKLFSSDPGVAQVLIDFIAAGTKPAADQLSVPAANP